MDWVLNDGRSKDIDYGFNNQRKEDIIVKDQQKVLVDSEEFASSESASSLEKNEQVH